MFNAVIFFFNRLAGASSACLFWMVEGNTTHLTPQHWKIALEVGSISAAVLLATFYLVGSKIQENDLRKAIVTTVIVSAVDISIHASHYPGFATEAILTGLTAALLGFVFRFFSLKLIAKLRLFVKRR
jgi:hypothetical protein